MTIVAVQDAMSAFDMLDRIPESTDSNVPASQDETLKINDAVNRIALAFEEPMTPDEADAVLTYASEKNLMLKWSDFRFNTGSYAGVPTQDSPLALPNDYAGKQYGQKQYDDIVGKLPSAKHLVELYGNAGTQERSARISKGNSLLRAVYESKLPQERKEQFQALASLVLAEHFAKSPSSVIAPDQLDCYWGADAVVKQGPQAVLALVEAHVANTDVSNAASDVVARIQQEPEALSSWSVDEVMALAKASHERGIDLSPAVADYMRGQPQVEQQRLAQALAAGRRGAEFR